MNDAYHMAHASALSTRGLGARLAESGRGMHDYGGGDVVGCGQSLPGGRPHAEAKALAMAGQVARGATAYIVPV